MLSAVLLQRYPILSKATSWATQLAEAAWEVRHACHRHVGENSHEEQPKVSRLEQKRYECPHDLRARSFYVVRLLKQSRKEELPARKSGPELAPGRCQFAWNVMG